MTIWRKLGLVLLGLLLVAGASIGASWLTIAVAPKPAPLSVWAVEPLPPELVVERVLFGDQEGFLREGCVVAFLLLSETAARDVQANGLDRLRSWKVGREGTVLSGWSRTPIKTRENPGEPGWPEMLTPDGEHLYAWPMDKCRDDLAPPPSAAMIQREIASGDAYYATFNRGEGLIVIAPRIRRAAYYYFG